MTKKIAFPRWPSEFPANMCRPVCLGGLTGRHWLAGNSEGHRGISKFLFLMVPYNYYRAWAIGIREVAFFYHLKFQSHRVPSDFESFRRAQNWYKIHTLNIRYFNSWILHSLKNYLRQICKNHCNARPLPSIPL